MSRLIFGSSRRWGRGRERRRRAHGLPGRARGSRPRGRGAPRTRGPPRGAREPAPRGRADRHSKQIDERSAGDAAAWTQQDVLGPGASGLASCSSTGGTEASRARGAGVGLLDLAPDAPVAVAARLVPGARWSPAAPGRDGREGARRDARDPRRRGSVRALAPRGSPPPGAGRGRLCRLGGVHESRVAAAHVVRRGVGDGAALRRRGRTVAPRRRGRRPRGVGRRFRRPRSRRSRDRARRRAHLTRQSADEARLDAEGVLVQDRLSVDAALASYRTGAVPFVTGLRGARDLLPGSSRRRRKARGLPPGWSRPL